MPAPSRKPCAWPMSAGRAGRLTPRTGCANECTSRRSIAGCMRGCWDEPMRIALVASARFPIREPFAGGLEAHTWLLARGLKRREHEVTVFAAPGCDPELGVSELRPAQTQISADA